MAWPNWLCSRLGNRTYEETSDDFIDTADKAAENVLTPQTNRCVWNSELVVLSKVAENGNHSVSQEPRCLYQLNISFSYNRWNIRETL